ncbi:MAG: 3-deoxy-7-phosphoheptulonate synthase [Chlamydiales bacterium]
MTLISLTEDFDSNVPTPIELQKTIPLKEKSAAFIKKTRLSIRNILNGLDKRKILIVGPCSIHDLPSALEYARYFKELAEEVSNEFLMIMRAYFEKPRTIHGWKGLIYDPNLDGSYNLSKGIQLTRAFLAKLADMGVPAGSEFLEITTTQYYVDLLSWGCIGARTVTSPPHRQLAASLELPIGFKNPIDGCIDHAIHGMIASGTPHVFLGLSLSGRITRIQSNGNKLCHLIVRGGYNGPNYAREILIKASEQCKKAGVCNKILVDCSHDNCEKQTFNQLLVFQKIINQILQGNENIIGLMVESYLHAGSQPISSNLDYGISITDPCLDWENTRKIILEAYHQIRSHSFTSV